MPNIVEKNKSNQGRLNMIRKAILTGTAVFLFSLQALMAADIYVDINQSDDSGDGSTWTTAKKYLQSGLAIAVSSDDIHVAQGTYYPDEGTGQTDNASTSTFQLISGVDIYGGYPTGGGTRDASTNITTLSGDLDQSGTKNTNDAYHVLTGANSATIDGFTITAGNADGNGPTYSDHGGGMLNNEASPTINDCVFSDNYAVHYGGAIHNITSSGTITSCTFTGNTTGWGGTVNNAYSTNTYTGCTFTNNNAGGSGGGMRNYLSGSPTVTSCVFTGNTSGSHGGAVYHNSAGVLTMTDCIISDNTSTTDGGGVGLPSGNAVITRCSFSGNQGSDGGAISTDFGTGTHTITNCVFTDNTASNFGGGIYNEGAYPTLMNCTLYNNTATTSGNGFYQDDVSGSSGLGTITNSILWGSNSEITTSPAGSPPTVTYSDVQQSSGTYTGTGNINADPLFVSGSDLHLTNYSPCIGAGTSTGAPADDREGNTRPDPPGSNPDMGAYENALEYSYKLVQTKIFLEGPYSGTEMTTALNSAADIPVTSPYTDSRVVNPIPNSDVVDWVYVQLRSTATGAEVASRSAFLLKNGNVVDDDGSTNQIPLETAVGSYYIILNHRNHLKVMSATAHPLSATSSTLYNFTTASTQFYGGTSGAMEVDTGVWGMVAGDADASGTVDALDRSETWNDRNLTGYQDSDCGLTGTVDANDRSITWNNRNLTTSVP
jgi:predicted outer membrane repeat protein